MLKRFMLIVGLLMVVLPLNAADQKEKTDKHTIRPALLVIDIQNQFLPYMDEREKSLGLEMINGAIFLFRQKGFPIIAVHHTDLQWGPEVGSEGYQFPESIQISEDDPVILKHYPNAFKKTALDSLLQSMDVNTLYLTGLSSVACVLATYFGAADLDYNAFMIRDAIMSHDAELTDFVEKAFDIVTWEGLKLELESASDHP